ncbi:hypothetical protein LQ327_08970 [Actinomycetospora endophytica]|uniref:Uncharacterized protein n=1 Tax=Actinomycetospora endophytica TaxID=2291215 RepID=A0ABS8P669_9PSEU|nr:hypothetical protein [Actinomycetospora endophytica]MCD2193513.1 hypothetical protein [Actinomycetospora endophytica]
MKNVHHPVGGTRVPNPDGGSYEWPEGGGEVPVDDHTARELGLIEGFTVTGEADESRPKPPPDRAAEKTSDKSEKGKRTASVQE